ncbi:hypothetical protein Hdeb2414_s0008g00288111 [Helianthus debilis subsp. tardiflorus]
MKTGHLFAPSQTAKKGRRGRDGGGRRGGTMTLWRHRGGGRDHTHQPNILANGLLGVRTQKVGGKRHGRENKVDLKVGRSIL